MKKIKASAILLTVIMTVQMILPMAVNAEAVSTTTASSAEYANVPSIEGALPSGNLLKFSRFNNANNLLYWSNYGTATLNFVPDENGGYITVTDIAQSHFGALYTPGETIPAGKYLFTGYFRTLRTGDITELRMYFNQSDNKEAMKAYIYPTNDWLEVKLYVELTDSLKNIRICGGAQPVMRQEYGFDQFSLVPVDSIPEDAPTSFGKYVSKEDVEAIADDSFLSWSWNSKAEEKFEVNGIVLNHDFSDYYYRAGEAQITENDLVRFMKQYEGTHITDYFISANDICANFPTVSGTTSYIEKYYQTEENGIPVDYTDHAVGPQAHGAHYLFEELGIDPIGVAIQALTEIGINPWMSFRMNDVHDQSSKETSVLFSNYYHEHPEYRRVQHHSYVSYYDRAMNYTHEYVREYMLSFINDALDRYDLYGIELDFQRDIWLWHIGGEYNGLDILNGFMRDLNDLVAIYEEKYGHEIKIGTSVAYDIDTNYDYGLDVITWIAEGCVDLIAPSCHWTSTDTDIPIRSWNSLTEPYGVILAPRIEPQRISCYSSSNSKAMDLETLSAVAANYFSQGAEKIYVFNYYKSAASEPFSAGQKITTKNKHVATMWTVLTTIGSYDKLMYMNRKCLLSWPDRTPIWESQKSYLPKTVTKDSYSYFRVPVGDVMEGSKLTLKFSVSKENAILNPPEVFVNSVACEFSHVAAPEETLTKYQLLCYEIPESVYNDTYMLVEIKGSTDTSFTVDYVEVYVKAPALSY